MMMTKTMTTTREITHPSLKHRQTPKAVKSTTPQHTSPYLAKPNQATLVRLRECLGCPTFPDLSSCIASPHRDQIIFVGLTVTLDG